MYSPQARREYLQLCGKLNAVKKGLPGTSTEFIKTSCAIHVLKARVPQAWRSQAFIRRVKPVSAVETGS